MAASFNFPRSMIQLQLPLLVTSSQSIHISTKDLYTDLIIYTYSVILTWRTNLEFAGMDRVKNYRFFVIST